MKNIYIFFFYFFLSIQIIYSENKIIPSVSKIKNAKVLNIINTPNKINLLIKTIEQYNFNKDDPDFNIHQKFISDSKKKIINFVEAKMNVCNGKFSTIVINSLINNDDNHNENATNPSTKEIKLTSEELSFCKKELLIVKRKFI